MMVKGSCTDCAMHKAGTSCQPRRPGAEGAWREGYPEQMYIVDMEQAMARSKASDPWEIGKTFFHMSQGQSWQSLLPWTQV